MKLGIVIGVRPEIVKMAPLIKLCKSRNIEYFVIHTGQHYSEEMDKQFFEDLSLDTPKYSLGVGSGSPSKQIASMISLTEDVLLHNKPDILLVYGDSNSALGPAIAASRLGIPIGHIEAGLRSFDRTMPEEINRIIVDHISDYLFAPTEVCESQLLKEGIPLEKIFVTGNTVVDILFYIKELASQKSDILQQYELKKKSYLVLTLHRPRNVDDKEKLQSIIQAIENLCIKYQIKVVFPIHPRTKKNIEKFGINLPKDIIVLNPLGYIDFINLENNAKMIITDSGSIQEEVCVLGIPCITLRDNTERPESITVGANILCSAKDLIDAFNSQLNNKCDWVNPYGDGHASQRILEILEKNI